MPKYLGEKNEDKPSFLNLFSACSLSENKKKKKLCFGELSATNKVKRNKTECFSYPPLPFPLLTFFSLLGSPNRPTLFASFFSPKTANPQLSFLWLYISGSGVHMLKG